MSEHDDTYKAFKTLQEYCNKRNINNCDKCIFNHATYCIVDRFRADDFYDEILKTRCRLEKILDSSNLSKLINWRTL